MGIGELLRIFQSEAEETIYSDVGSKQPHWFDANPLSPPMSLLQQHCLHPTFLFKPTAHLRLHHQNSDAAWETPINESRWRECSPSSLEIFCARSRCPPGIIHYIHSVTIIIRYPSSVYLQVGIQLTSNQQNTGFLFHQEPVFLVCGISAIFPLPVRRIHPYPPHIAPYRDDGGQSGPKPPPRHRPPDRPKIRELGRFVDSIVSKCPF